MAINYCTLASSTIDTFCGSRRAIVLNRLIAELHPPRAKPAGGGGPSPSTVAKAYQAHREWEKPINLPTELDRITVTVEFQNLTGSAFQDVDNRLDFVVVTNIEFNPNLQPSTSPVPTSISVNIADLKIER